ncbi:DUF58 domain-containing protein [Rummeliibacillus pycnus]|uniref:DUF58 domain-containing protein n=1 Tax=Rummeliibacillus pycnus TaxID=101070 RepID=UPI001473C374|nr:DUF58 domain-containing protein [Rummeliibacillus pycnus]
MKKYKIKWLSQAISRLVMVVLLLVISLCFALMQGGFVSWFIFFMFLPFALYSFMLFFVPLKQFSVERTMLTRHLEHGDSLRMRMTLTRKSRFPLLYTVIQESIPSEIFDQEASDQTRHFFMMGMKKQLSWDYEIPNITRGHHQLEGIELTITDFFGWIKKTALIPAKKSVIVYPKVTKLVYKPLRIAKSSGAGTARNTVVRDTTMVSGIREYQPGDRMTWIHWKTFAKTQNMQTKEFEDQQSQEICLVLDGSPSALFEEQVELCASILTAVVSQHLAISFLNTTTNQFLLDQIQTEEQLQQALYQLAGVQPKIIEKVEHKFGQNRILANAAMVYFVTGSLTSEWLNIMKNLSRKSQGIICFIVRTHAQVITENEQKLEKIAKENDILVFPLTQEQFANAFMEVLK